MPDPDYDEPVALPGDFEENLKAILDVDPDDVEDVGEEPGQDA